MIGGNGNDGYVIDDATDTVVETSTGGAADRVFSSTISLSLASYANVERATLTGALALNLTGNVGNNVLTGNTGNNLIDGGGGIDTMAGSTGNDTYIVDTAADVVTEAAAGGTADTVRSAVISLNLANYANVENITLTGAAALNATGNSGANVIIGNTGANTIFGGGGADTFTGGSGADVFVYTSVADSSNAAQDFFQRLQYSRHRHHQSFGD